ncbi:MAG: alpha/beta fold hydrolase [Desulfosudis oleivorans]|nr:alpha/beta fold hydrolase [Desulfosudis oleivorans]
MKKLIGNQDDSTQWHKIKRTKKVKGVALLVHGLNLKPERMQSIITELNDAGIDVVNLSLRGHGNNYKKNRQLSDDDARLESFQTVTYRLWLEEIYTAYLKVRQRAYKKRVPVFFVGFSLGGLLGCDLLLLQHDVSYDRMVLFAPALNITVEGHLLKALMPFPNMVIDSLSPIYYRSNAGTPMAAYKALFEAVDHFNKNANNKLNKPTLILIDEKDEFVSCSKLNEMIRRWNLDHWKIQIVQKDNNVGEKVSHHLIIDRDSVGKQMWQQMKKNIKSHLSIGY